MLVGHVRSNLARGLTIGLLSLCGATVAAAAGADAASAQADLGSPDVSGYCQHLGFSSASFTSPPNQRWQCVNADGSTSPVDMQAACEFSFPQRPILAKQLTPGVLYTWQCLQTAGSGGPGTGGGSGAAPTLAQLKSSLLRALTPVGRAAKIGTLRKRGSYSMRFRALAAGSIRVSWLYQAKGAAGHRPRPLTVAAGRATISRAGTASVKIGLTAAGRRLLGRAKRIRLTAKGSFTAIGTTAVVAAQAFTLSR